METTGGVIEHIPLGTKSPELNPQLSLANMNRGNA